MKETRIISATLAALATLEGGMFWRNNTGAVLLRGRKGVRPLRFGRIGSGDILGVFLGRAAALEGKTATGRQSAAQKEFQREFESAGGLYILFRCPEDALKGLGVGPSHPRKPAKARVIYR